MSRKPNQLTQKVCKWDCEAHIHISSVCPLKYIIFSPSRLSFLLCLRLATLLKLKDNNLCQWSAVGKWDQTNSVVRLVNFSPPLPMPLSETVHTTLLCCVYDGGCRLAEPYFRASSSSIVSKLWVHDSIYLQVLKPSYVDVGDKQSTLIL